MKLYPIPGGLWAGTEADWKKQMKARGLNPKDFEASKTREVPVAKADLLEWLNFFAVDVYRNGGAATTVPEAAEPPVDVGALRALHNPTAAQQVAQQLQDPGADRGPLMLQTLFDNAPIGAQLQLATAAIDNALTQLAPRT